MFKNTDIFSKFELKKLLAKKNSCVVLKRAVIEVFLVPCYLSDVVSGLKHALNKKLKSYDTKLEGIVLGFDNIKVNLDEGKFAGRNAEILYPVSCDCFVFQPVVGKLLEGVVNRISDDHIGCVCLKYFNATIKRPEDESYERWNSQNVNMNQAVTFRVKELDYTGVIPYIEGEFGDEKPYPSDTHAGSSESGVEDVKQPVKKNKKKKEKLEKLVNSTQVPSSKASDNCSDSGLDFDFLSPIPTPKSPTKKANLKRKAPPQPSPSKSSEKTATDVADPEALRQKLLQDQLNSLQLNLSDEPAPSPKKRKKTDKPKKTDVDKVVRETPASVMETIEWVIKQEADSPAVLKSPSKKQKESSADILPKSEKSPKKTEGKKSPKKGEKEETVSVVSEKTPKKTGARKAKQKVDPTEKKMAFYLKKLQELASQQSGPNFLQNMLNSSNFNAGVKDENT